METRIEIKNPWVVERLNGELRVVHAHVREKRSSEVFGWYPSQEAALRVHDIIEEAIEARRVICWMLRPWQPSSGPSSEALHLAVAGGYCLACDQPVLPA